MNFELSELLVERFMDKVHFFEADKCWNWLGARGPHTYGRIKIKGKLYRAHRVSYYITNGTINKNEYILHSCDNTLCVNPSHLRQGTHTDNMRDRISRGRHPMKNRTECPKGHSYTEENTVYYKGGRSCRVCANARTRESRRIKKLNGQTS